jgi:hypothetical protein
MDRSSKYLAGVAVGIVLLIFISGYIIFILVNGQYEMLSYWLLTAFLMVSFLAAIGKAINNTWTGILINELKVMSLSRLQIVIWTVIILSAFLTIATARIYAGPPPDPDPLNITIGWQLWALLGISSTSLVATPVIMRYKKGKNIAFINANATDAKFTDIFEGDETGNEKYVDMSKVQMFFFTIISALSYIVLLFRDFLGNTILLGLPVLPEGLIAILTISHGAYLTYKRVDHT